MKRNKVKVGMWVVVKDNAVGVVGEHIGKTYQVMSIDKGDGFVYVDVNKTGLVGKCYGNQPQSFRKATQGEILSTMTTQELQQLLDEIDVELDKRLAAVHADAKYMFRECVVDGHTCYVMGFGDAGSNKPSEHLLISGHPKDFHGGERWSFSGDWVGRNDLLWQYKRDVKLVNEDGSLEDVL